ncbi:MAG: SRPBCC family protein [Myxococcota bacterium]|nr:SRPBCC family protein [Myxococcota bacterium]
MSVSAPMNTVWAFITDAERVAQCMPGAEIVEQLDDKTYLGKAKVKLGAITTAYKGEVAFEDVDESAHTMRISGTGRETGGGTAKGTLDVTLVEAENNQIELTFDVRVDLTGRVMQMGRGMIKGVSAQLFKQFAQNALTSLEAEATGDTEAAAAVVAENQAVEVGSLVGRTLWQMIVDFFKRLFGGRSA